MKFWFSLLLSLAVVQVAHSQTYVDSIAAHRQKYIADLLAEPRLNLKQSQVSKISFYPATISYAVLATVTPTTGSKPFMIPTKSGKQKPFREYSTLTFKLASEEYVLHAYQGMDLIKDTTYRDYLFVPFKDRTNYDATYGGGRYIDLSTKDIVNGRILLDFNKCYNPYCAFADGFNCPIPPDENSLPIEIAAGEKTFIH
jgi:uncharacterized protein (DUF1684 family)